MGWPLNLSVIWRQAPRFFRGLTGYTYSEGTGPLEKSAALYQKDWRATTFSVRWIHKKPAFRAPSALDKGYCRWRPLVAENRSLSQPGVLLNRCTAKQSPIVLSKWKRG